MRACKPLIFARDGNAVRAESHHSVDIVFQRSSKMMLQRSKNTFAQLYKTGPGVLISDARTGRALPAGREQHDASAKRRCHAKGGKSGQTQKCGAGLLAPHSTSRLGCYAAAFFALFTGALTAGLGVAVFAAFAFSLAANSCLTWTVNAATSTL